MPAATSTTTSTGAGATSFAGGEGDAGLGPTVATVTSASRRRAGDAALALGVAIVQIGATYLASRHQPERRAFDLLAFLLLAVGPVALLFRRRYPVTVLLVSSTSVLAYWVIGYGRGPVFLAMIVALATVVMAGRRAAAIAVLVGGYISFQWLGPLLGRDESPSLGAAAALAAWLLVLYGGCELVRIRQERVAEAAQLREEETRRRVSDERLRIARELHDVIAHNISLINVQAATTLHRLDGASGPAPEALATIKRVSQETLVEMRSVLGALRHVDEAAPRAPLPTLSRLDELVERAHGAGVSADVAIEGEPRPLPAAVDLAAYRVAQEALTNVARHATTTSATVRVAYRPDDLVVEVDDDGTPPSVVVAGNGITGMRERAGALGGTLSAAPRAGGGFRVRAWFPLGGGA
jgi:signal transduction histidine kinase